MKVIAGHFRGRSLQAPPLTRPMTELVRGAIFNSLGNIEGSIVLDLFAGSGALGIEAISRDAGHAVLVERSRSAASAIRRNISELKLDEMVELIEADAWRFLMSNAAPCFDVIFIDPPYNEFTLDTLEAAQHSLQPGGVAVVSTSRRTELPATIGTLVRSDEKRYGDTKISYFTKE